MNQIAILNILGYSLIHLDYSVALIPRILPLLLRHLQDHTDGTS
jgi:hypothetical protein